MLQPGGTIIIFFMKNTKAIFLAMPDMGITEGRKRLPTEFSSEASEARSRAAPRGHVGWGGGVWHPLQPLTARGVGRTPDDVLKLS